MWSFVCFKFQIRLLLKTNNPSEKTKNVAIVERRDFQSHELKDRSLIGENFILQNKKFKSN